jgi:hypothetical protein
MEQRRSCAHVLLLNLVDNRIIRLRSFDCAHHYYRLILMRSVYGDLLLVLFEL